MADKKITWSKSKGYECSTKGDNRFSAFVATLEDGRTIEQHYQCDIKGYDVGGTDWKLGKGKPPLDKTKKLFPEYINLWKRWSNISGNYQLLVELKKLAIENGYYLRDSFATTPVNQAHALVNILNDMDKASTGKITVEAYTDGSARPNPGAAGYGFYGTDSNGVVYHGYGPIAHTSTNNVAEIMAVVHCITQFRENLPTLSKIKIFADSKYVLDNMKNVDGWRNNRWCKSDGSPVANAKLWEHLDGVVRSAKANGIAVSFEWVKAHNGTIGNEYADENANRGRAVAVEHKCEFNPTLNELHTFIKTNTVKIIQPKKVVEPLNPLFFAKRWFFFTNVPEDIKGIPFYFGASYEDKKGYNDKNLGKRAPSTMYTLMLTTARITVLDMIRELFNAQFKDSTMPVLANLTKLRSASVWGSLVNNTADLKFVSNTVVTAGGEALAKPHFPPKLSCKIPIIITTGYSFLELYKTKCPNVFEFDITDYIYQTDNKKLTLNPKFVATSRFLDLEMVIPYFTEDGTIITPAEKEVIRLTVNVDIPPRNTFSAAIKQKSPVKITLLVMDSVERSCRITVIVEQDDVTCVYFSADSNFRIKK